MKRIQLGNTEFEGKNASYILDRDGLALVDTGIDRPWVREQLQEGLAEHGYRFEDVDDIVLTHHHGDHTGLAGAIQERSGATVYAHEADVPLIEEDPDAMAALADLRRERFAEWNIPQGKRDELLARFSERDEIERVTPTVEPLVDGDELTVGGWTVTTVHAPGHAAGACCFEFDVDGGREAFTGDALLPKYTPNVGGADLRVERPLERYLTTLHRIASSRYRRAWPGHRDPIDDPTARAEYIISHHRERTENVLDVLREHGPADAWTVSAHLFGELKEIHILHGPGEAYAHLDHLERHGIVTDDDGRYDLADTGPIDLDGLFAAPSG